MFRTSAALLMVFAAGCLVPEEQPELTPLIDVSPASLSLRAKPGESSTGAITIFNRGDARLVVDRTVVRADKRRTFVVPAGELPQVEPGESAFLAIEYRPENIGTDHGRLEIHSNADHVVLAGVLLSGAAIP